MQQLAQAVGAEQHGIELDVAVQVVVFEKEGDEFFFAKVLTGFVADVGEAVGVGEDEGLVEEAYAADFEER